MVDNPKSDSAFCLNHEPSTANYQLKMRAMLLEKLRQPLRAADLPTQTLPPLSAPSCFASFVDYFLVL